MKTIAFAVAAFGLAASASAASAETLAANRGQKIDLGGVNGTAYYTVEAVGYRVVATVADTGSKVLRIEAVLAAPGQSVVLSSPSAYGEAAVRIEITRRDGGVEVQKFPATN